MVARNSRQPTAIEPLARLPLSLRALASRGETRHYRKGSLLIQEGDYGDTIYIILAGRVRAFAAADTGREITYGIYGPGEYLGEMSLDGGPRSASVETLEAATCSVITRQTLTQHLAEHPQFAFEMLAKLIRLVRTITLSARQLALNDVYGRLKALLDTQCEAAPGAGPDAVRVARNRLTHQAIAHHIGCSREMVSRVLKDLEHGQYLSKDDRGRMVLLRELPARW